MQQLMMDRLNPFEWYRTAFHRFCSEYGFQSFPEPKTVRGYTNGDDRNITRSAAAPGWERCTCNNTSRMTAAANR